MTITNIIEPIKTFIATYSGLTSGAALTIDTLGQTPTEYSIMSLPGGRIVTTYVNDATEREYPFAFQATLSTADEAERIVNNGFFEDFAAWLESQTNAGTLPTLETGKTATKIEALGWGFPLDQGESGTAIYQITCKLTYDQIAP